MTKYVLTEEQLQMVLEHNLRQKQLMESDTEEDTNSEEDDDNEEDESEED
jgi:hypothetical protein